VIIILNIGKEGSAQASTVNQQLRAEEQGIESADSIPINAGGLSTLAYS
jgi:hypothetical protein